MKPTRYLIGSMWAEKILMITPLLTWYIKHGLEVTKIHQIIEFAPKSCFKAFADRVSNDRRNGDSDPALKVVAETSKLIGGYFELLVLHSDRFLKFCSIGSDNI